MFQSISALKKIPLILIIAWFYPPGFYVYAAQPEYILDESPHPDDADDIKGPLDSAIKDRVIGAPLFPELKKRLRELPAFIGDSRITMKTRIYDFDRNNSGFVDSDGSNDNRALASGGVLEYQSGLLADRISIGTSYYTSQKIVGPANEGGTLLLVPEQTGFGVLGQAYVNVKVTNEIEFRAYRQSFDLPYLNRRDSRMVPVTHEAYSLRALNINQNMDFISAFVNKIKQRDADNFVHLSDSAGASGSNDGLFLLGGRYRISEKLTIGAINYYSFNVMDTFYAEANAYFDLAEEIPIHVSVQYTHQQSVGDELTGDFSSMLGGAKASLSYRGLVFTVAGNVTENTDSIRSPYGGRPNYTSLMVKDFDRAGEKGWLVGLAYDFGNVGIDGLSAFANYASGSTPDSGNKASPDQQEWNFTVDFKPKKRLFKGGYRFFQGLWLRFRHANVNQDGAGAIDLIDNRIILNWEFPIL